ncbi:MAG: hypothetical protein KDD43_00620, partial [Bdellovibrionales bacterium]|nr:hypothetical protein [Bdellovibrionales bacterium]
MGKCFELRQCIGRRSAWFIVVVLVFTSCSSKTEMRDSTDVPPPPLEEPWKVVDLSQDRTQFVDGSGRHEDYSSFRADCEDKGWIKKTLEISIDRTKYIRPVLYRAPDTEVWRGSILILHGGGSHYAHWCNLVNGARVRFASAALQLGFSVFLLNSTDITTDAKGNLCGKIWDDNVLSRDNLDLPYVHQVITKLIPSIRPLSAANNIFVMGFSSGGFMTTRIATSLSHLITAFAPIG